MNIKNSTKFIFLGACAFIPTHAPACFAKDTIRPAPPCFECFAKDFVHAINAESRDELISIMGERLATEDNIKYALDSSFFESFRSDAKSIRDIINDSELVIAIEAVNVDSTWRANMFFVPKEKLKRSSLPVISQLGDLRVMRDYVVCEVYHDGKRFLFSQHFCFAETDVLD